MKNLNWLRKYDVSLSLQNGRALNTPHSQAGYSRAIMSIIMLHGRFLSSLLFIDTTLLMHGWGFFQSFNFTCTMSQQVDKYLQSASG